MRAVSWLTPVDNRGGFVMSLNAQRHSAGNLAREPRWGRNIETPGEDPYLTGEYATAFVTGFEVSEDDPKYIQARRV